MHNHFLKLEFYFHYFRLSHFPKIINKSDTLQDVMLFPHCHENNQNFFYDIPVVYVERIKLESFQVWALPGILSLNYN